MNFCECGNMYYMNVNDDNLTYTCKACGNQNEELASKNICVSKTVLRNKEPKIEHMVNEYTKYDPTLPRINNMKCPNCDNKHEVIYLRYDDIQKKYLYICTGCDTIWKSSDQNF